MLLLVGENFIYIYVLMNYVILRKSIFNIIILIGAIIFLPACKPIRHYTITKRTQKWEKEHFDPDRPAINKKKKTRKPFIRTQGTSKRIG